MSREKAGLPDRGDLSRRQGDSGVDARPPEGLGAQATKQEALLYQEHAGPLPAPWALREYEEIQEGAADRIISMAEEQQAHVHSMEKKALAQGSFMARTGQILAFLVVTCGLAAGTYLLANDKSLLGAAVTIAPFVGLASLFVWRRQIDRGNSAAGPAAPPKLER